MLSGGEKAEIIPDKQTLIIKVEIPKGMDASTLFANVGQTAEQKTEG